MKFIHLVPVLGMAAVFGAAQALPSRSSHALARPPSQGAVVPPWLVEDDSTSEMEAQPSEKGVHASPGEVHADHDAHSHDVHAHDVHVHTDDVHVHTDDVRVHAGEPRGADPQADPHAELCAAGYGPDDPHAELCAAGYGAGDVDDVDPHAGASQAALGADDPYQRVGLQPAPAVSVAAVERSRAPNGHTVAEVYSGRQKLVGQKLRVRGTVVKLNEGILGQTYLHLRDGSGSADRGDDDLTVTTTEPFELGQTVELEGELAIDRDVGAGYVYAALLTKATRVAP